MRRARLAVTLGWIVVVALVVGLAVGLLPGSERIEEWIATLGTGRPLEGAALWRAGGLLACATLLSEDLACLAAGALVAQGTLGFAPAAASCFLGIFVGDMLLFLAGRLLGPRVLARAPCRWFLDERRVAEAARWLERRGGIVILSSRFLPGARLPTYFASGALGTSLRRFALWFALAGLLWTPALVAIAAGLGGGLARFDSVRHGSGWWLLSTFALGVAAIALAKSLASWRGRALWRMRLRRLTRYEYWPIGIFYLPVFVLVLARALRGQALVFTAANPALPHGGFVGESKEAIHELLEAAGAPLPPTRALGRDLGPRIRRDLVAQFMKSEELDFPLVVKPDAGQRGEGVRIVRDAEALEEALASPEALIVQGFVPGEEYGLFYAHLPGAPRAEVFSITHKELPTVMGDGQRTLEELILGDPKHLPMARFFLERHAAALDSVPPSGECVPLGELGTHCRGARFLDGRRLGSEELLIALERIAGAMPGFHFGRFDVRAFSGAALSEGRFVILELNGVTSEAGHLYDPRFGLFEAWSALLGQWRRAYAIGAANARAGARVSSLEELRAALRGYRELVAARELAPLAHPPGGSSAGLSEAHP